MYKYFLLILILTFSLCADSFTEEISFDEFQNWVNALNIEGYEVADMDSGENTENLYAREYTALLSKSETETISLVLSEASVFDSYVNMADGGNGKVLDCSGYGCVYILMDGSASYVMGAVKLEKISATLKIMVSPGIKKNDYKELVSSLKIGELTE